jgi:hypothetical protein
LRKARLKRVLKLRHEPKDLRAALLVRLVDGSALLMEKRIGGGRVVLSAAPFDLRGRRGLQGGNLPRLPSFVPWIHELVRHVVPSDSGHETLAVGDVLELPLPVPPADGEFRLLRPGSRTWEQRKTSRGQGAGIRDQGQPLAGADPSDTGPRQFALVEDLDQPGLYRIRYVPRGGRDAVESLHAVVLNTEESHIKRIARDRLRRLLARPSVNVIRELPELLLSSARTAQAEMTPWLWPLLVLLLLGECLLSNRMYR